MRAFLCDTRTWGRGSAPLEEGRMIRLRLVVGRGWFYFYFCNRKNKLVGGGIHILWIDYNPKSFLKFLVFWDTAFISLCGQPVCRRCPVGSSEEKRKGWGPKKTVRKPKENERAPRGKESHGPSCSSPAPPHPLNPPTPP